MRLFGFLKNKKAVIVLIAAAATMAAAAAAYFLLGGKSARDLYLDAESKNFQQYAQIIKKSYTDFNESRKPYKTGNYKTRTEITLDVKSGGGTASDKSVNGILDVADKCKLIADSKNNPTEKTNLTELSLLLEKTPFLDAEIFSKDQQLYFTVPAFTPNRYFKLDTGKLNEVYDRFNIPVKPLRVPSLVDAAGAIELDFDEFDNLTKEYGSFISKSIRDKDVKFGKSVEMNISGQKAKGREVTVNLDGAAFTALMKGLAEKAGSDDIFAKLTCGNFAAVSEIVDEAGIFRLFDYLDVTGAMALNDTEKELLKSINVKKDLDSFKKQLGELFKGCDFTDGLKMDMVIDNTGNILDRKAVAIMKNTQRGKEYEVSIHTGTNSLQYNDYRNRYLEVEVSEKSDSEKNNRQYFKFNPSIGPSSKDGGYKGSMEISWGIDDGSGVHSATAASLELDTSADELTMKENSTVKYNIEMQGNNEGQPEKLTGEIKTSKWKNNKLKTRNRTTAFAINADLPDFGITGFSAVLNLAGEDKLEPEPFKLPEVGAAKVVDLNTATDQELNKVLDETMGSFGTFYMTNKPIVDAVLGK